jgi:hypothetical protein
LGLGVIAGLTFRIASVGIDIDLNMTYRRRPSRIVEDTMYKIDLLYNLNFTWNNLSASRN